MFSTVDTYMTLFYLGTLFLPSAFLSVVLDAGDTKVNH